MLRFLVFRRVEDERPDTKLAPELELPVKEVLLWRSRGASSSSSSSEYRYFEWRYP